MTRPPTQAHAGRRVLAWLALTLVINALLTAAVWLATAVALGPTPETIRRALKQTAPAQVLRLQDLSGTDSWYTMISAYRKKIDDPRADLYEVFFVEGVKFQYPPSSLLFFDLFPGSMIREVDLANFVGPLRHWLDRLSRVAVVLTALASAAILELALRRRTPDTSAAPGPMGARFVCVLALGLTCYPLLVGHFIGQIQVFLNALIALALLSYLAGWRVSAGICVGVCCLVKPQYGLVLLWALLRRQWRFIAGLVALLVPGLAVSIARFGWYDHVRYLDVVRALARVGESFWFNQSVNGLLNRLLENGSPVTRPRMPSEYPPYHPVVYALTVLSSVALLIFALWRPRAARRADGGPLDLMVMLVAITMASPIAWNHHYGVFLPIFAATLPLCLVHRPWGRATIPLLALSYVTMANALVRPQLIFQNRWLGLAGSHLFFGSLLFFGLLLGLRAARSEQPRPEAPAEVS